VRVVWTENAIGHLVAIYGHIAKDSPFYAQKMVDRLTRRSQQITDFPQSGRTVPEYDAPDVRELIERPYRIVYRIQADRIDVLAVIHGAQQMPSNL
jgi:toxin ParE1/3/4